MRRYESRFRSSEGKRFLEQWYENVRRNSSTAYACSKIDTRFGETHVAIADNSPDQDNPAVVFIHGWSGNGMLWDLTDALAGVADRYKVILVDVIGQPGNSSQETPPFHSDGYGLWLADLLDGLSLPSARFVGMSFGSILIARLAKLAPERIDQAVFIAPAGFTNIRLVPKHLYYFGAPRLRPSYENLERFIRKMMLGPSANPPDEMMQQMVDLFTISFKYHKPGAQLPRVLPDEDWESVTMPSLVLAGENDALFNSQKVVNRASAVLPNLWGVERYAGLGHAMENYPMLVERVSSFFSSAENC